MNTLQGASTDALVIQAQLQNYDDWMTEFVRVLQKIQSTWKQSPKMIVLRR